MLHFIVLIVTQGWKMASPSLVVTVTVTDFTLFDRAALESYLLLAESHKPPSRTLWITQVIGVQFPPGSLLIRSIFHHQMSDCVPFRTCPGRVRWESSVWWIKCLACELLLSGECWMDKIDWMTSWLRDLLNLLEAVVLYPLFSGWILTIAQMFTL